MSSNPELKDLHDRAAQSARETRSILITLSTASIGALFFIATTEIKPVLDLYERTLVIVTIAFMMASLCSAIWFAYSDAQWSYFWGLELDGERPKDVRDGAEKSKLLWHARKSYSEKSMLILFFVAAMSGGLFVLWRIISTKAAVTIIPPG
jgi:hypothetical protein